MQRFALSRFEIANGLEFRRVLSHKRTSAKKRCDIGHIFFASKLIDVGEELLARDAGKRVLDPGTRRVVECYID